MSAKAPARTFAEEIAAIARRHDGERWRMGICHSLAFWTEFVAGWASASSLLARVCPDEKVPPEVLAGGTDEILSWGWSMVESHTNAVLFAVDQRTAIPSCLLVTHFQRLSGSGLILPDGSVVPFMLRAIERRLDRNAAEDNQLIADSALASQKLRDAMAPKADKTK